MGFLKSRKGSLISDYFRLIEDVGDLKAGNVHDVALYKDHLSVKSDLFKQEITLKYDQITDIFYGFQHEIIEKNKSVIGRGIAGGLLFGGAGAIVGAISGTTGKKKKKESKLCFIISYTSSSGEDRFLSLEDTRMYKGRKIAKMLKEFCGIQDEEKTKESHIEL